METLCSIQKLVDSRLQSMLDGKPQSIKIFAKFYRAALFHPTTTRSLVIASLLERLNKNSGDYRKCSDSDKQWKYKIQQDHILVMLAQAMPPQLQTKVPLINEHGNIELYHFETPYRMLSYLQSSYYGIHLANASGSSHLLLFSGTAPFAHYNATPLTMFFDALGDIGEAFSSTTQTKQLIRDKLLKENQSDKPHVTFLGHSLGGAVARREAKLCRRLDTQRQLEVQYRSYSAPHPIRTHDVVIPWISVIVAIALGISLTGGVGMLPAISIGLAAFILGIAGYSVWSYANATTTSSALQMDTCMKHAFVKQCSPGDWSHMARYPVFDKKTTLTDASDCKSNWYQADIEITQRVRTSPNKTHIESTIDIGHGYLHPDDSWRQRHLTTLSFVLITKPILLTVGFLGWMSVELGGRLFRAFDRRQATQKNTTSTPKFPTLYQEKSAIFAAIKQSEYGYSAKQANDYSLSFFQNMLRQDALTDKASKTPK